MNVEWLNTLALVREMGSFSAAARERGVSAMAISKQISQLEKYIGEAVVIRTHKTPQLTEAGVRLLQQSQGLRVAYKDIHHWLEVRDLEPEGQLTVLAHEQEMLDYGLLERIGDFRRRYPKIQLSLDIHTQTFSQSLPNADIFWGVGDYLGQLHPNLKRRRIGGLRIGIFAAPEYLLRHSPITSPADLAGHQMIGYSHNNPADALVVNPHPHYKGAMQATKMPVSVLATAQIQTLAEQGLGLFNTHPELPSVQRAVEQGRLLPVLPDYWYGPWEIYAYVHNTRIRQPKIRAFLDFFIGC